MWHGWRIWREQRCLLIIFFTSLATNKGQNCFLFCMMLVLKAQISGSVPLCSGITQLLNVQSNSLWKSAQRNNIDCGLHEGSRIRGGSRKIVRNIKVMWPLCLNMQNIIAGGCVWSGSSSGREHEMAVPDRARERHREPGGARQHQPAGLVCSQDPLLLQGKWELRADQSWSHFFHTKIFDFCLKNSRLHSLPFPFRSGLPWLPMVLYSSPWGYFLLFQWVTGLAAQEYEVLWMDTSAASDYPESHDRQ